MDKQIKMGAIISYLSIIFNIITGLIYTPWMVNKIGRADYGLYTLATSVVAYFSIDFGFGGAISKFIAQFRAEKREGEINRLLSVVYKLFILLDVFLLIALVVIYCLSENIFVSLTQDEIIKFRKIFLIVGAFSLISFPCTTFNGILIAYEKFVLLKISDLLSKVLVVTFIIIILCCGYGIYSLVIINAVVQLCINIIKYIAVKKTVKGKISISFFDIDMLKMIFSFSVWVMIITISQRLIFDITPSILGITSGTKEISIFSIAHSIEWYIYTFAYALNSLFLPKVSNMVANNVSRDNIMSLMIKVGRLQLVIVGGIITTFTAMGSEFIILWMGELFANSYFVAVLIILPSIITLTQDIGYTLLMAENKVKYRAICYILSAVISIWVSFMFSNKYGAIGSAIGILVGNILGQILAMNFVFHKKCGLNMRRFYSQCHIKMLPILVAIFVTGRVIQHYWPVNSLMLFAVKCVIIGTIYLLLIYKFYINEPEKDLVKTMIRKISFKRKCK